VIGPAIYVELLFLFSRLVRGVPARTLLEHLMTFAGAWAVWTGAGGCCPPAGSGRGSLPLAGC
jgi:hypothetical protein